MRSHWNIGGMFGNINLAGIEHYNNLIDALILKGTNPHAVTAFAFLSLLLPLFTNT